MSQVWEIVITRVVKNQYSAAFACAQIIFNVALSIVVIAITNDKIVRIIFSRAQKIALVYIDHVNGGMEKILKMIR
jgi:hypothetical protein